MNNPSLIPSNPDRRKVIIVLSSDNANIFKYKDDEGLRAHPNICIVEYDKIVSDHGLLDRIKPMILPNVILIQSPYDLDVYEIGEDAVYKFSVSKHVIASQIFRLLGCKSLEVMQLDIEGEKETRQFRFAGEHPELTAEFKKLDINERSLISEVKLKEIYQGSKPRIKQAYDYLAKHYLTNDSNLMGLIEKRSDESNKMNEYSLQVTLTQETKHTVDFLGTIGIPHFLAKIEGSVNTLKQNKTEFKVTYKATF
ncbi:MAG: hypothetical protein GXY81_02100 [Candidatus Cloacimonetes bacterium]|nr:hypothetical protein [Candidatus Cloacimonadota bacterium]